jgi:starch synthase
MDILMACSGIAPIVKSGGSADAVAALSKTLGRLEHKVTIAMPRYPSVDDAGLLLARRLTALKVKVGDQVIEATLFDSRLGSGVELLFIDMPGLFDQAELPRQHGEPDPADGRRFGLFCRALAAFVDKRAKSGSPLDVVHAHDWSTALLPFLLRGRDERTVLTVHDGAQQGRFAKEAIDEIGLSWDDFHPDGLEFYEQINLLKAGVLGADVVTTVSPSYAEELGQPGGGNGLDGVFRQRAGDLVPIINGIDYARWSPATDPHLAARYDAEDVANKGRCKAALLHELDLPLEPERPLLVALGPLTERKGSDLLAEALWDIVRTDALVVIGGEGDADVTASIDQAAASLPGDAIYLGAVTEPLSHRLVAAADGVLLPSRSEPCGLDQQHAQRYGALPIAHAVGGLKDTVVDADAHGETGTGFLYDEPTAAGLTGAVSRAVAAMRAPSWAALRRRAMRLDLSWERPARRYARLYQTD